MKDIKIPLIVLGKDGETKKSYPYKQAVKSLVWESTRPKKRQTIYKIDPSSDYMFHNGDIIKKPKESPKKQPVPAK